MSNVHSIADYVRKRNAACVAMHIQELTIFITQLTKTTECQRAYFGTILTEASQDPSLWWRTETQKKVFNMCRDIDMRKRTLQDDVMEFSDTISKDAHNFMTQDSENKRQLHISWDQKYRPSRSLANQSLSGEAPIAPEEVLCLFAMIDRFILFHRESLRQSRYGYANSFTKRHVPATHPNLHLMSAS